MRASCGRSVAALAVVLTAAGCSKDPKPTRPVDAGIVAIQHAVLESIPGATEAAAPARFSDGPPGSGAGGGGGYVFGAQTFTARFDWSVLIAGAPFGIAGLIVEQADAQARVLRESGFEPLDAGAAVFDRKGAPDEFAVSTSQRMSGRSHGWSTPRDVDRLEHRRIYHAPGTGAFVIARIGYDGRDHTAAVEMTYVEATVDAKYPAMNIEFHETVSKMPRKR